MYKIKCISRSWLHPRLTFIQTDELYEVGKYGVLEITPNDSGCFNVEFETGETISVTDVQYVEYLPKEDSKT